MPDNPTFSDAETSTMAPEATNRKPTDTRIVIEDETQTPQQSCCSWTRMCDVLGNRQGNFIEVLRPLRNHLIKTQQVLRTFQLELERGIKTRKSSSEAARISRIAVHEINKITMNVQLNIPPQEGEMLRHVSYEISVLWRVIEEVAQTAPEIPRSRANSARLANESVQFITRGSNSKSERRESSAPELRSSDNSSSAVDEHSLKERITRCCDTLERLLMFIDKKTERRWWLRDVINFLQLFIKLALFVSAAISVAYHEEQVAPIITLTIAIVQGVVEMLDQYFLKHTKPEEIKLSVVSTLTAVNTKT